MLAALIAFTLATISWSLWIRRFTWTCRLEVAATLNIALQGAALFLMSPYASSTVGEWLYDVTGQRNLEDWLGHDCYVVAASAIVYNAVGRLGAEAQERFKSEVEVPATLCIPLLFVTFTAGVGVEESHPDFFRVPTDMWLTLYWWLLCGTLAYLLAYGWQALIPLRREPESRTVATVYMVSSSAGILACLIRIVTAALPGGVQDTFAASFLVWVLACGCGGGYAAMSACAWRDWVRAPISAGEGRRG
ncbi:hypothetical protein ACFWE3_11035 [Mycobacteriaceae bacterium NPDC060252]